MQIKNFKIKNYKSFIDSKEIIFEKGFNVIVGQNNVGKTALLEGLSFSFASKPHVSKESKPIPNSALNAISSVEFSISVSGNELYNIIREGAGSYGFPINTSMEQSIGTDFEMYVNKFFEEDSLEFLFQKDSNQGNWLVRQRPSLSPTGKVINCIVGTLIGGGQKLDAFQKKPLGNISDLGEIIYSRFLSKIYCFRAERMNIASCQNGVSIALQSNASNLAEVLHILQSRNRPRFARYNTFVHQIFQTIYEVRIIPVDGNRLTINLVIDEHDSERDDLLIPLEDCGTGVSQVLAILYVAITAEAPKVIIIDEPNSFLHPGAARKLIEILKRNFPQHQYIVSTHSPEVISAANPNTITLLKWSRPETELIQLHNDNMQELSVCLSEVGARLSDVFGADKILWVEGKTEEECFELILSDVDNDSIIGLSIVAVRNTGDFDGKKSDLIWDIYTRLSTGSALLPPLVGFVFDREQKTDKEIDDLKRKSKGIVQFLDRRMYENYLLDPTAISNVINSLQTFEDNKVTPETISDWILANGNNKYIDIPVDDFSVENSEWLAKVDGAKLLHDLFVDLSDSKESYIKTVHSYQLTKILNDSRPEYFDDLRNYLIKIIDEKK